MGIHYAMPKEHYMKIKNNLSICSRRKGVPKNSFYRLFLTASAKCCRPFFLKNSAISVHRFCLLISPLVFVLNRLNIVKNFRL